MLGTDHCLGPRGTDSMWFCWEIYNAAFPFLSDRPGYVIQALAEITMKLVTQDLNGKADVKCKYTPPR